MARLIRIDSELVRRGLARSRTQAAQMVTDGHVTLDGVVVTMAEQLDLAGAASWSSATVETSLLRPGAGRLAGVGPLPRSRPVCRISLPVGPDVLRARREMLAGRATTPCRSGRTQGAHGGGI